MQQQVLEALEAEAKKACKLINDLNDRNIEVPQHLLDSAFVVANVAKMVESEGVLETFLALVATYPAAVLEEHFDVYGDGSSPDG
jgi:hypothetical protein